MTELWRQNHLRIITESSKSEANCIVPTDSKVDLEIAKYFFRLGLTGFGGPLAIVAQMERDLTARGWIQREKYAQLFATVKTMPGPIAFQMAVIMGQFRGGFRGAALAAILLNLPAAAIMIVVAASRASWTQWSWVQNFNLGLQATALGLIAASVIPLIRSTEYKKSDDPAKIRGRRIAQISFAVLGFVITAARPSLEPLAILTCGALAMTPNFRLLFAAHAVPLATSIGLIGISGAEIASTLGWTCFKAGAMVFGSGLAIVPLLGSEFVDRLHWLTQAEFLEALMFGQITPGPIVITATYIGYRAFGFLGSVIATVAVFSAPFFHMTTWFPLLWQRLSQSQRWKDFGFGATACVAGAVVASVVKLAEPIWLAVMEVESLHPVAPLVRLLLWTTLPVAGFLLTWKMKAQAWMVILAGGALSSAALWLSSLSR